MRAVTHLVIGLLAVVLTWHAGPQVDQTRAGRHRESTFLFAPDPDQIRMAATGFEELIADVMWVRSVLAFGDAVAWHTEAQTSAWLRSMVETVNTLDPTWRTAYYYGGVTLRVLDDLDGSDAVFKRGAAALPEESFFPFSIGMNAFLYREDPVTAADWLSEAARRKNAPRWYHSAAASMKQRGGSIEAGLQYLREQLEATTDDAVRDNIRYKIGVLEHDQLVLQWTEACKEYRRRSGHALARPEDLRRLGLTLPANPRGDAWVVGLDGVVRSADAEGNRIAPLRADEKKLLAPL